MFSSNIRFINLKDSSSDSPSLFSQHFRDMKLTNLSISLQSSLNQEAAELLEILTRFELEGVCYAFDQILASERLSSKLNHAPITAKSSIPSSNQGHKEPSSSRKTEDASPSLKSSQVTPFDVASSSDTGFNNTKTGNETSARTISPISSATK